jgi:serine/threonine protein phosphatase PrpC
LLLPLYLCTDGFWNNPSAQGEREKDPITFTNFTDVFLEAGKDCFSLFISEDGSQNNVTLLQRCLGRRIRSPPLTLQMSSQRKGKGRFSLHTSEDGSWNSATRLQRYRGRRIRSPPPTLRLLRGFFSTLYLCTDDFWNNSSARVGRAKDLITFTNFSDAFLEAGKIASPYSSLKMVPRIT